MDVNSILDDAYQMARASKEMLVLSEGIGSDLAPAILSYDNTGCNGCAVLVDRGQLPPPVLLGHAAAIVRAGWSAQAVALITEAYSAPRDTSNDPRPLAERFITDPNVHESIVITAVDLAGNSGCLVAPYTIGVGRLIHWHEPEQGTAPAHDTPYTSALHDILTAVTANPDLETEADIALAELGFVAFTTLP